MSNKITYHVILKDNFIFKHYYCENIKSFVGKLINQNSENFFFETKDDSLIIIPHSAIYIMYPIKNMKD